MLNLKTKNEITEGSNCRVNEEIVVALKMLFGRKETDLKNMGATLLKSFLRIARCNL